MLKIQNYYKLTGIIVCLLFVDLVHAAQTGIVNFSFSKAGVYRIDHQQLLNAGVDLQGVKHNRLALTYGDDPVYIKTTGQTTGNKNKKKFFGPGASITFVVPEAISTQYTDEIVYTLHVINNKNKKLRKTIKNKNAKPKNNVISKEHYKEAYFFEEQNIYSINTGDGIDPWVMDGVFAFGAASTKSYNFDLDGFEPSQGDVEVSFLVSGASSFAEAPDHHVQLKVNGTVVDDQEFDGFDAVDLSGTVSSSQLTDTGNSIELSLPYDLGLPFEFIALDKFSIEYPRKLNAINNALSFASSEKQFKVTGFDDDVAVYQVLQTGPVLQLTKGKKIIDVNNKNGLEFALKNSNVGNNNQFFTVADNGYLLPGIKTLTTEEDITSGSGEYLIITHPNFYGAALDRLVQLRQAKYAVKVVNIEQVYAQFGKHVANPAVIKDYIKYAVENLSTKMVVLIGGETYDYKNYEGSNSVSFIPTTYSAITSGSLSIHFSPSDASYGDLNEDGVPEIPIGRFPVRTAAEMVLMVDKIEDYENRGNLGSASYSQQSIFVADHLDNGTGYSFTNDANALISKMPQVWQNNISDSEKAYLEQDGGAQAKAKLLTAINNGVSLVSYVGHSNHLQWSFSNPILFNTADAANLLNTDKPTIFTQWGCWNTYYVLPAGNGLGQSLLLSGNNGAATVLGASTLTQADTERGLANFLYQEMFKSGKPLGQAVVDAKQAYSVVNPEASDVFLGWQILGDPAIEMQPAP